MTAATNDAVVFDWNGTLLADIAHTFAATGEVLERLGKPRITMAKYRDSYSMPISDFYLKIGFSSTEIERHEHAITEIWTDHYSQAAAKVRLRRGARRVLESLKDMGHGSLLLSNHYRDDIAGHAKRLRIDGYFHNILANDHFKTAFRSNGKQWRLEEYAKERGIGRAIVIGDSVEEVEIARNMGFVSVAITGGFCSEGRLRAAKPDYLVGNLSALPEIARKVFGHGGGI